MTTSTQYDVELLTHDVDALERLFGNDAPRVGTRVKLGDGVSLEVVDSRINRGVVETSILVGFVLQVASGVAVKVLGELLAERLKGKRASLKVNGTTTPAGDAKAIEAALTQAS